MRKRKKKQIFAVILIIVLFIWFGFGLLGYLPKSPSAQSETVTKEPTPLVINTKEKTPVEKNEVGVITVIDDRQQMIFQYRGVYHSWEAVDGNAYVVLELRDDVLQ